MNIKMPANTTFIFGDLKVGDLFIYSNNLFLKCKSMVSLEDFVDFEEDRYCPGDVEIYNALCLTDNTFIVFSNLEKVVRVDCDLICNYPKN